MLYVWFNDGKPDSEGFYFDVDPDGNPLTGWYVVEDVDTLGRQLVAGPFDKAGAALRECSALRAAA